MRLLAYCMASFHDSALRRTEECTESRSRFAVVWPLLPRPSMQASPEFFGGGQNVYPSKLAMGWNMPHQLQEVTT